jgi:prepilin-type N-terminal cleavage/methylation domain-containing protein
LNNNAFTLLELIVVMVLITIVTSFAVPQIANFLYADQLKVSARKLVGLINQSAHLAQRQQSPYLLRYSSKERKFTVEPEQIKDDKKKKKNDGVLQLTGKVAVRDIWSFYGGVKSGEDFTLRINGSGYVEPTIIHLRDAESKEMSMLIPPFLGTIQLVDTYVDPDDEKLFQ